MERDDPWARIIAAAGAAGAAIALVYLIGGASLSLRYDGFGLPGQQAAALTPREVLLAAGLRTLVVWAGLGFLLVLVVRAFPDAVRAVGARLRRPSGVVAVVVVVLAMLLLLNVWWPLAGFIAVLTIILASAYWGSRPVRRILVSTISIALVAVAYEADRLSYQLEWTCVSRSSDQRGGGIARQSAAAEAGRRLCGILIGQQDRGFYLGVPSGVDQTTQETLPYRLIFIPSTLVQEADSRKELAQVITSHAEARRESLHSRLSDVRVR